MQNEKDRQNGTDARRRPVRPPVFYRLGPVNEVNPDLFPGGEEAGPGPEDPGRELREYGATELPRTHSDIHMISIIGQVEGHLLMPGQNKTTKYEHIIPQLVAVEESPDIRGLLVILNTVGGDVEAGLAIAELIAGMRTPTASLVLGGGHSIGVPIAVAADRSFIAETATMTIHPIRLTGMVVGVQQSFDYLERMQDRVVNFVAGHSHIRPEAFKGMMMTIGELARDVGTVAVGRGAVECGLIDQVGGVAEALEYLHGRIREAGERAGKKEE